MHDGSVHLRCHPDTYPDSAARADAWCAAMSVSAEIGFEPQDVAGFSGSLDMYPVGSLLLGDIRASPFVAVRSRSTRATWSHDHVIFDFFPHGGFEGHIGGRPVTIEAGDCVMFDLKGSMRIRFRPMRCLALVMPRHLFDQTTGGGVAVDGLVFRAGSAEAHVLGPLMEHAVAEVPRLSEAVASSLGLSLMSVIASCAAQAMPRPRPAARPATPTLPQLLRFIERHATEPDFGPEHLCAHFALSRTQLYRLFASAGGIAAAIRLRRTTLAVARLRVQTDSPSGLADVATASGFADVRALRRALRAVHNISPEEVKTARGLRGTDALTGGMVGSLFDGL